MSDNRNKAIMFRFGGIGDSLMLTAVARILNARGFDVTFCVPEKQVELYNNLIFIKEVKAIRRLPNLNNGVDCVKGKYGWVSTDIIKRELHAKDYLILDYKFSIEANSQWRALPRNKHHSVWCDSMNSNYMNWVDLSLAWANIDWTAVDSSAKRPVYKIEAAEIEWALQQLPSDNFVAVNLTASSLARTFYSQVQLVKQLIELDYPVLVFDNKSGWTYLEKNYRKHIPVNSVRQSAALIYNAQIGIFADSGISHIAEAIGLKNITLYTTVPAWTRCKYYLYTYPMQTNVECSPCFIIGKYCPLTEYEVDVLNKGLTKHEKQILKLTSNGRPPHEVAAELGTNLAGIQYELNAIANKKEALKNKEPKCMHSFDINSIIQKMQGILGEYRSKTDEETIYRHNYIDV